MTNSSWESTKKTSIYHFDSKKHDPRWDTVTVLGKIRPIWLSQLPEIIEQSRPASWETRGYKSESALVPREDLAAEEYDLERIGADPKMIITNLNWQIPDCLQKVSDCFGLDDCMNRIHVQWPGQVWNLHIDKLQKWNPTDPTKVIRIMIQLNDWQPGYFWSYGNYCHSGWAAGEVTTFDWANVPHSTANAGHSPRATLQITGVITNKTLEFLNQLNNHNEYIVD
jgi:hypothetical protein